MSSTVRSCLIVSLLVSVLLFNLIKTLKKKCIIELFLWFSEMTDEDGSIYFVTVLVINEGNYPHNRIHIETQDLMNL